ncbi:MAG: phospholipase, partial [Bacteroidales bacterium]|nr:phospholipase [Bacteroidales bacterium]
MWKLFLIIAVALLLLGVFSWLASYFKWFEKPRFIDPDSLQDEPQEEAEECCGQHEVCEKDLKTMARKDIVYYNDEELDAYIR